MNPAEREFFGTIFFTGLFMTAIASGVVGNLIGLTNGRRISGFWWGFFLGPIGWLIVLTLVDLRPKCRECLSVVDQNARRCKSCGVELYERNRAVDENPVAVTYYKKNGCGECHVKRERESLITTLLYSLADMIFYVLLILFILFVIVSR